MIKLKDLLFEKVAHTQKSLQWVGHDYIPMTPKVIKQIMGDTPITVFHNLDPDSIKNKLSQVIGSKKSISSYIPKSLTVLIIFFMPILSANLTVIKFLDFSMPVLIVVKP